MAQMNEIKIEIDKELDLLTAYIKEVNNPLDVIAGPFDGHMLFFIDSQTKELARIEIYDFKIIRRILVRQFIFLITKKTIKNWLSTIADSFKANHPIHEKSFAH